jgi:hypothetical protein
MSRSAHQTPDDAPVVTDEQFLALHDAQHARGAPHYFLREGRDVFFLFPDDDWDGKPGDLAMSFVKLAPSQTRHFAPAGPLPEGIPILDGTHAEIRARIREACAADR